MHMPNGWQLLIILAVILLLFGAARLPALARSLGQSARVFRGEMKQLKEEDKPADGAAASTSEPQAPGYTVNGQQTDRLPGTDEPGNRPNP